MSVERILPVAVALILLLATSHAFAQAATGTGPVSGARSLGSLQQLLLSPPEPRLNLFVTPQYTHERYDEYREDGTLFDPDGVFEDLEVDRLVRQPKFSVDTTSVTAGGDYWFQSGLLLGASLTYSHANYDFKNRSLDEFADDAFVDTDSLLSSRALGEPLDREFDEYGVSAAVGYLKDPWTVLLTGSFSRRDDIETKRRQFNSVQVTQDLEVVEEIVDTDGNTDADVYAAELGAAYRFGFAALSLQPSISIGYQREEVDAYTEGFDAAFQRPVGEQQFVRVGEDAIIDPFDGRSRSTIRTFNDQTIESIPLKTGVLFSAPLGDPAAEFRLSNVALGALYTHDFENQRYNVKALSINSPPFSVDYREKNRNQDFLSFTGALDFKLGVVRGTISHQQDVGFDERQRAYIVRLQLRVPVSF